MARITTRVLNGFDDPTFGPEMWEELMRKSENSNIFLTWYWQRAWWETCGSGELLLITAERDGEIVALAPFYTKSGMIYFVCTGFESDHLDFIGDISDPAVLKALLETARDRVPEFEGFEFYFVPGRSGTGKQLERTAERLGLSCYADDETNPVIDIAGQPEIALAATRKKSLLRHERLLTREGPLHVTHLRDGNAILPYLGEFFDQHVARWAGTETPSRFVDPRIRALFKRFTAAAAQTGWLRFTRLEWKSRTVASHLGTCYRGHYIWGSASFAIDLTPYSPGEVLLRQLLLAAIEEGARTFDFRTGSQPFKLRFATHVNPVHTWSMYPAKLKSLSTHDAAEALP